MTLWPGTIEQHYRQELGKLSNTSLSLAHSRKKRKSASSLEASTHDTRTLQHAQKVGKWFACCFFVYLLFFLKVLESVKRRQIIFQQSSCGPLCAGSTSRASEGAGGGEGRTCPVCSCPLPSDEGVASAHVTECLERAGPGSSDSEEEEYEEYTWCNMTRVRATSMLSPQARASE